MSENSYIRVILQAVVAILVLLVLLLTGIRILLTPAFVNIEYRMPYFPEDPYGMTQPERLKWAPIALDYLMNDEGISFLGDLTFDDGTPLYNQRELQHMLDVKILTQLFVKVWYGCLALSAGLVLWAWRGGWKQTFLRMVSNGGLFSVILLSTLVLLIFIQFDQVFVTFHHLFFEGDSWLFLYSDTLIRLFPLRFWQDAFVVVGVFTLAGSLAAWLGLRKQAVEK